MSKTFKNAPEKQWGVKQFIARHNVQAYPIYNAAGLYSDSYVDYQECFEQGKFTSKTNAITCERRDDIYRNMMEYRRVNKLQKKLHIYNCSLEDLKYSEFSDKYSKNKKIDFAFADYCGLLSADIYNWLRNELFPNLNTGASVGVTFNVARGVITGKKNIDLLKWRTAILEDSIGFEKSYTVFGIKQTLDDYYLNSVGRSPFFKGIPENGASEVIKNVSWYASVIYGLISENWIASSFHSYVYDDTSPMVLLSAHGLKPREIDNVASQILKNCDQVLA